MAVGANTSNGISANGHKHQHHQHYASSPAWWKPPIKFRPPGAPAGAWPHLPWHASVLHDPYERINFWSHFVPGLVFFVLGPCAWLGAAPGGNTLAIFCFCAALTHLLSALTHVWPDDHTLEKCDHIGIVALIAGTPLTAAMAMRPGDSMTVMLGCTVALLVAAFLRPFPRTILFVTLGAVLFFSYFYIVNLNLCLQVAMYLSGAAFFLRNHGHDRWPGWTDHHLLHYFVTAACLLHVWYIIDATQHQLQ